MTHSYLDDPMPAYEAAKADPRRIASVWLIVDSNGYDVLVETPEIQRAATKAHDSGRVTFAMTHIQYDELVNIPEHKAAKRAAILEIPFVFTPTYGLVVGISRIGYARVVGDSNEVDRYRSPNRKHTNDALLAATATFEHAILVTNDDRLTNFATRDRVEVWSPQRLVAFLTSS
jgi:PIN domain.